MIRIEKYSEYIKKNKIDNLFSSQQWLGVLEEEYQFDFFVAYETTSGSYLPFTIVDDLKGRRIISLPFCDYINTLQSTPGTYKLLLQKLQTKYPNLPIILKTTFHNIDIFWKLIRKAYYHRINCSVGFSIIQNNYSSSFKRAIRKAINNNVNIEFDNSLNSLNNFYDLYTELRKQKFNSIPQAFSFFKKIYINYIKKQQGFILNAKYQNTTIASIIVLKYNKGLYYKFGASDFGYLHLRPNNLLFHHLLKFAVENEYDFVDLGLTGSSEQYAGLLRFKESMGGKKYNISYYRIDPENYDYSKEEKVNNILNDLTNNILKSNFSNEKISKFSKILYKNFA